MPLTHITAVYPGSFDPVTHGHLNVIERGSRLFNEFVVGVGRNPDKSELFTPAERRDLLAPHVADLPNVRVETYEGLTIDFVLSCGGRVLVRGIRDASDLSSEMQQANVNQAIGEIETVFLMTSDQYALVSSTFVKQIYELGGGNPKRIRRLVPDNVAEAIAAKLGSGK
jgi:pantetheine-phosphate adenylyltransferase